MLVTINRVSSGSCIWCCPTTGDAVDASFTDGLKGTLCRKHFWEALKSRSEELPPRVDSRESTGKSPSA
ncbi:MAG TPA: hypothetical protein VMM76_11670 [Pirellulaceae bacterium]|nr:hypothetical protein [Pirellulaceae bacterium]